MAVCIAAINSLGIVGGFVGPLLWGIARDATGSFHAGLMAMPAAYIVAVALILLTRHSARQAILPRPPTAEPAPAL
jgi:ACS family tartrate transporter-like MFS transporter